MARDRLVFETTRRRRAALAEALQQEGLSISEWFQEQVEFELPVSPPTPVYEEIHSAEELKDVASVLKKLRRVDWAFSDDDTQFLSHDVHPYPAKFIPQIPGNLIANLSLRGELVLDPFGGSGTTALEAVRLGRRAVSLDANPIGGLIGRVKTARLDAKALADLQGVQSALKAQLSAISRPSAKLSEEIAKYSSVIPNVDKWFPATSSSELGFIRSVVDGVDSPIARDLASIALSKVVLRVSFQDSETRYAARPKEVAEGATVRHFLRALEGVIRKVVQTAPELQYGIARFETADSRTVGRELLPDNSVDLVVTSPPYGNSNDYHLYHRFRLFWLGFDPRALAKVEIGSHLRHQKEGTGFESYLADMRPCLVTMARVLKPGRFAAIVVGDALYSGRVFDSAAELGRVGEEIGLEMLGTIERPIHVSKRSFVAAARRARTEKILLLRKPPKTSVLVLQPPAYKMWPYERVLRAREIRSVLGVKARESEGPLRLRLASYEATKARRLTFTRAVGSAGGHDEPTWQGILENGTNGPTGARKDPKYVTHGIHAYKGKFYPQLAKCLLNVSGVTEGATVLDPFCGSGTTLLECRLNGMRPFGCDLHPLAVKIALAKTGILDVSPQVMREAAESIAGKIDNARARLAESTDQFDDSIVDELQRWFPKPVVFKLNWLLRAIRSVSSGVLQEFLEVVFSDIVREVSHQEPSDLRIRRRKQLLRDADVTGLFKKRLAVQMDRLRRFWVIRGYCPYPFYDAHVTEGDSRGSETFRSLGLAKASVDVILTSPPYATALPYIDTDRLSLLLLFGLNSSARRPLETGLLGSREIALGERKALDARILSGSADGLPETIDAFIQSLHRANSKADVGFRRQNLPSLLLRFFTDMGVVFGNCSHVLKPGGQAMVVVGDNATQVLGKRRRIPTTDFMVELAEAAGLSLVERIPITVTTENLVHLGNAITQNEVLRFKKG